LTAEVLASEWVDGFDLPRVRAYDGLFECVFMVGE